MNSPKITRRTALTAPITSLLRALIPLLAVTCLALLGAPNSVWAAPPQQPHPLSPCCYATPWQRTFGGSNDDYLYSIAPTSDGGYIAAGPTGPFGSEDGWVIKLDANGNQVWQQTLGGSGDDYLLSIAPTSDGGYITAGGTDSFGAGLYDGWVLKLDANGNQEWQQTFGGSGVDSLASITPTNDGGFAAAGYNSSLGAGYGWVIKLDGNGNQVWQQTYVYSGDDYLNTIAPTSDGGYITAGYTGPIGEGYFYGWAVKIDADGNQVWNQAYTGDLGDLELFSIVPTSDGGYLTTGYTNPFSLGYDGLVMKLDANGNEVGKKTYGGAGDDGLASIAPTRDGGYITAGFTDSFGAGGGWVLKLDAKGNQVWQQTFGGDGDDELYSIAPTRDGGYITAGFTDSFGAGGYDGWVLKLDANGRTGPNPPLAPVNRGKTPATPRARPGFPHFAP
jgi:hypothetical protein